MSSKLFAIIFILTSQAYALPIDWNGVFALDTTLIDNYQRNEDATPITGTGSAVIPRANANATDASFQTYIFKLKPTIIVNDSASLFANITTGYASGGYLGQGREQNGNATNGASTSAPSTVGNTLYYYNSYRAGMNIRELYAKFYSDTATYTLGRQPLHWGLGAIQNGGNDSTDRFASVEDGVRADLTIGNFTVSPYYMKVDTGADLDKKDDIKSTGLMGMYKNSERDLSFGVLYGKRKVRANNTQEGSNVTTASLGPSEVKMTDIYFQKGFGRFNFELEVPIMEGELGSVYTAGVNSKFKAKGFLTEMTYEINPTYSLKLYGGLVSGDGGSGNNQFEALYINPNYQVANLMYRYNLYAVDSANGQNIFDSYITNTRYLKLEGIYNSDKWTWTVGLLWAKAEEVAKGTGTFFRHEENKIYTALATQSDDLGYELDIDFDYEWNTNVNIIGSLGYHIVGDYYRFTNTATEAEVKNAYAAQMQAVLKF